MQTLRRLLPGGTYICRESSQCRDRDDKYIKHELKRENLPEEKARLRCGRLAVQYRDFMDGLSRRGFSQWGEAGGARGCHPPTPACIHGRSGRKKTKNTTACTAAGACAPIDCPNQCRSRFAVLSKCTQRHGTNPATDQSLHEVHERGEEPPTLVFQGRNKPSENENEKVDVSLSPFLVVQLKVQLATRSRRYIQNARRQFWAHTSEGGGANQWDRPLHGT